VAIIVGDSFTTRLATFKAVERIKAGSSNREVDSKETKDFSD
jgi:hypothetical protein